MLFKLHIIKFQPALSCKLNEVLICTIDTISKSDTRVIEVSLGISMVRQILRNLIMIGMCIIHK